MKSSQYRGVTLFRPTGKWRAQISTGGKTTSLGDHDTEEAAARAFDRAAINKLGPDAKTNYDITDYDKEVEQLQTMSASELVQMLRSKARKSTSQTSTFRGVSLLKQTGKWHAQINVNGKQVHLGFFPSENDAARAYDRAAINKGAREGCKIITNYDIGEYNSELEVLRAIPQHQLMGALAAEGSRKGMMEMLSKGVSVEAMEKVLGRALPSGPTALKGVPSVTDLLRRAERAVPKMNHSQLWSVSGSPSTSGGRGSSQPPRSSPSPLSKPPIHRGVFSSPSLSTLAKKHRQATTSSQPTPPTRPSRLRKASIRMPKDSDSGSDASDSESAGTIKTEDREPEEGGASSADDSWGGSLAGKRRRRVSHGATGGGAAGPGQSLVVFDENGQEGRGRQRRSSLTAMNNDKEEDEGLGEEDTGGAADKAAARVGARGVPGMPRKRGKEVKVEEPEAKPAAAEGRGRKKRAPQQWAELVNNEGGDSDAEMVGAKRAKKRRGVALSSDAQVALPAAEKAKRSRRAQLREGPRPSQGSWGVRGRGGAASGGSSDEDVLLVVSTLDTDLRRSGGPFAANRSQRLPPQLPPLGKGALLEVRPRPRGRPRRQLAAEDEYTNPAAPAGPPRVMDPSERMDSEDAVAQHLGLLPAMSELAGLSGSLSESPSFLKSQLSDLFSNSPRLFEACTPFSSGVLNAADTGLLPGRRGDQASRLRPTELPRGGSGGEGAEDAEGGYERYLIEGGSGGDGRESGVSALQPDENDGKLRGQQQRNQSAFEQAHPFLQQQQQQQQPLGLHPAAISTIAAALPPAAAKTPTTPRSAVVQPLSLQQAAALDLSLRSPGAPSQLQSAHSHTGRPPHSAPPPFVGNTHLGSQFLPGPSAILMQPPPLHHLHSSHHVPHHPFSTPTHPHLPSAAPAAPPLMSPSTTSHPAHQPCSAPSSAQPIPPPSYVSFLPPPPSNPHSSTSPVPSPAAFQPSSALPPTHIIPTTHDTHFPFSAPPSRASAPLSHQAWVFSSDTEDRMRFLHLLRTSTCSDDHPLLSALDRSSSFHSRAPPHSVPGRPAPHPATSPWFNLPEATARPHQLGTYPSSLLAPAHTYPDPLEPFPSSAFRLDSARLSNLDGLLAHALGHDALPRHLSSADEAIITDTWLLRKSSSLEVHPQPPPHLPTTIPAPREAADFPAPSSTTTMNSVENLSGVLKQDQDKQAGEVGLGGGPPLQQPSSEQTTATGAGCALGTGSTDTHVTLRAKEVRTASGSGLMGSSGADDDTPGRQSMYQGLEGGLQAGGRGLGGLQAARVDTRGVNFNAADHGLGGSSSGRAAEAGDKGELDTGKQVADGQLQRVGAEWFKDEGTGKLLGSCSMNRGVGVVGVGGAVSAAKEGGFLDGEGCTAVQNGRQSELGAHQVGFGGQEGRRGGEVGRSGGEGMEDIIEAVQRRLPRVATRLQVAAGAVTDAGKQHCNTMMEALACAGAAVVGAGMKTESKEEASAGKDGGVGLLGVKRWASEGDSQTSSETPGSSRSNSRRKISPHRAAI